MYVCMYSVTYKRLETIDNHCPKMWSQSLARGYGLREVLFWMNYSCFMGGGHAYER